MKKAVFLDKDGTLVENVLNNHDVERVRLLPKVSEGLRRLHDAGYVLLIVSNQAGIAHGLFSEEALHPIFARVSVLLDSSRNLISGVYYCPHDSEGRVPKYTFACACRKPLPGLLLKAAGEHSLDLKRSWMIGDILHDVEAGRRAGCRTILVNNGHETEWKMSGCRWPDFVVTDLDGAADRILGCLADSVTMERPRTENRSIPCCLK